jgi:hypothetical protein
LKQPLNGSRPCPLLLIWIFPPRKLVKSAARFQEMVSFTLFDRVKAGTRVADDLMDLDKTASETLLESLRKEAVQLGHSLSESHSLSGKIDWQHFSFESTDNNALSILLRDSSVAIARWLCNKPARFAMVYLDESVSITFRDWQLKEDNPSIEDTRQALADVVD